MKGGGQMQIGKISEPALKRSVLRPLWGDPAEVMYRSGADCAQILWQDGLLPVYSVVNEVPGFADDPGMLIVAAANNLAAGGAEPEGFLVSAMLPPEYEERQLKADMCLMKEMAQTCMAQEQENAGGEGSAEMQSSQPVFKQVAGIIGGHTQISSAVTRPLYSVTGIGSSSCAAERNHRRLQPGDVLVVTDAIALGGTAAIARKKEAELQTHYPFQLIDRAKSFAKQMAVGETARAITHFGAAAMHDLSQGGIFNALWEMADQAGVGLEVDLKKIPVRQETIEICEYFDINPYYLYSAGALLVGTAHGEALVSYLAAQGISAAVIGRVTDGNDRVIRNGSEQRYLDRPKPDEWYRIEMETKGQ